MDKDKVKGIIDVVIDTGAKGLKEAIMSAIDTRKTSALAKECKIEARAITNHYEIRKLQDQVDALKSQVALYQAQIENLTLALKHKDSLLTVVKKPRGVKIRQ